MIPKRISATRSKSTKTVPSLNLFPSTLTIFLLLLTKNYHNTNALSLPLQIQKINPLTYGSTEPTKPDQVMQVASFRNNLTSPEMMIASQQAKREADSSNKLSSALEGVSIGAGIGVAAGVLTFVDGIRGTGMDKDAITMALQNGAVIGGTTAALLGYNNYAGNRVYVMSLKEAINRLTVDYVASLKIGQDVGFAAYLAPEQNGGDALTLFEGRFRGCGGIVGCVDCQLRNSGISTLVASKEVEKQVTTRTFPGLPSHVHLKNMEVDEEVRRRGVARRLVEAVEEWAKDCTDAELLTLEVDESNEAAVKLYESCGFQRREGGNPAKSGSSFGLKTRAFLCKTLQ